MTAAAFVHAPIRPVGNALTILDAGRRLYAGLNPDGTEWHVLSPTRPENNPYGVLVGSLWCSCDNPDCPRLAQAVAFEAGDARQALAAFARADLIAGSATFDAPAGAGEAVEAWRG